MAEGYLSTTLRSPTHPILLRPLRDADAPALAALLSDPRNTRFESPAPPPMSAETAAAVVGRMRASAAAPSVIVAASASSALRRDGGGGEAEGSVVQSGPGRVNLAIVLLDPVPGGGGGGDGADDDGGDGGGEMEGNMIGLSGFGSIKDLDGPARVGDVGAMIHPDYRGRGYAAEAIRLSVDFAFRAVAEGGLQLDGVTAGTSVENLPMLRLLEARLGWEGARRPNPEKEGVDEMFFEMSPQQWEPLERRL